MDQLYMIFGWGSPIGTGIFLVSVGVMVFLLANSDKNNKKSK